MDSHALLSDGVKECAGITRQNLMDGGVAEHGVETANAGAEFFGWAAGAGPLDGFDGTHDAVDRIANGVREVAIEEEEFENAIGGHIGCVDLAVGLERGATTQKAHLLKVLDAGMLPLWGTEKIRLIHLEQRRRCVGALQISAETNELPSLPVNHGGVAYALEEVNAIDDGSQEIIQIGVELVFGLRRTDLVIEAVKSLPLFGGDFFAHLTGVLAGAIHTERDREAVDAVKDESPGHRFQIAIPFQALGIA